MSMTFLSLPPPIPPTPADTSISQMRCRQVDLGCPQPDEADREGGERGEGHTCGAGDKDLMDSHLSHPKWFYQRIPLQSDVV